MFARTAGAGAATFGALAATLELVEDVLVDEVLVDEVPEELVDDDVDELATSGGGETTRSS